MVVIGLGKNLLFKSVLAHCDISYLERLTEVGYFEDFFEDKFDVSQQSLIVADLLD